MYRHIIILMLAVGLGSPVTYACPGGNSHGAGGNSNGAGGYGARGDHDGAGSNQPPVPPVYNQPPAPPVNPPTSPPVVSPGIPPA